MKRFMTLAAVALLVAATSCGNRQPSSGGTEAVAVSRQFPVVTAPSLLEGQEQIEFIVEHYWDAFLDTSKVWMTDSLHVDGVAKGDFEQAFANYVYYLDHMPMEAARKNLSTLYDKLASTRSCAHSNAYPQAMEIAERYLYDANSPLRNEDYWQPLVAALAADPATDPDMVGSYEFTARTCNLNRVGTRAADFRWSDKDGMMHSLYGIKADYTLLFFSNPGCQACKEIIETLRNSLRVDYMLSEGRLAVVNVYIDEDVEAWYGYMSFYPEEWYNGYDPDLIIRNDLLYNVRAIPSLYVLDKDKTVLMKDAPEQKVFAFLDNCN